MEMFKSLLTNPVVVAAIITATGAIIAAVIGRMKKKDKDDEPPLIIIPSSGEHDEPNKDENLSGVINGIEIVGTSNMDNLPLNSPEYLTALAAQGEMIKNKDTVFEVFKEES